ncbi:TonB family protein [Sphingomonas sp. HF-S4]|uniref:TonB family protein n=1 Tax=Sphingomonas agrestis TaxID=3080540 RepID=A0ABU3YAX0_9SPHN|nr:TonB family protein [Sphingomonas sp. HF-S4]MDV3458539.1 TonB family protein [Sphingomonas sp. HF-S4]
MYAEHRYAPQQSRAVSFGAAFAINGALIAGLIFAAPEIMPKDPPTILTTKNIPITPPPEPLDEPKPRPLDKRVTPTTPLPTVPDPIIPTRSDNVIATTNVEYPPLPPLPPAPTGETRIAEPPASLPPLIGAEQDGRYARDFQPGYPSIELRAQRDGVVKIRVLIGTDGRVKAAESVSATSDAFFDATRRQALSKWRFKPATRGGVPQESWKTLTVRFELENQ